MSEPHDGHRDDEVCPGCPHRPTAMPPNHGEWLPDTGTYEDGATEEQRRTEVRATTCRRLGHHWTPGGVCDRCGDPRPAAGRSAAAAPAVERATPDPDILAALIRRTDPRWPLTQIEYDAQARALIAAGVTLNQPATTPTETTDANP